MASDTLIPVIDTLNIGALLLVGFSLIIGFKTNWASIIGIGLLLLYYLAHPPFPGYPQGPSEGSYWLVNKNLIEAAALFVIYLFPTQYAFGLAKLFAKQKTVSTNQIN
jgi:thiosulfate dehydrogenase [quinone] large subunit